MPGLWALGWTVTTVAGIAVSDQFAIFGAFGAITFAALHRREAQSDMGSARRRPPAMIDPPMTAPRACPESSVPSTNRGHHVRA
jgi:hypothetical protein